MVSDTYYHDDPVAPEAPKRKKTSALVALVLFVVGGFYIQSTLAANVSLNSGAPIQFGQGISQTVACSGATNLTITPNSNFVNASGAGAFMFASVSVSNIPSSCNGYEFTINAYGNSGNAPLAIFNSTSTNAVIFNNAGTFQLGTGVSGASITSGSGSFTFSFASPVATAASVFKVTLQSGSRTANTVGTNWVSRTSAEDLSWEDIAFGNGIFVAVNNNGIGNRVMTSTDGITWTSRATPENNAWQDVAYGNGIFVAVAYSGTIIV
jgi:hypothetical protein